MNIAIAAIHVAVLVLATAACTRSGDNTPGHVRHTQTTHSDAHTMDTLFALTSTAFAEGGAIPRLYTCDDRNISPPLGWAHPPSETKSLALICDDPDAPRGTWVHWVLFNIPPTLSALEEGLSANRLERMNIVSGVNDFGNTEYGGPCPPGGTHHYSFRLYAIDGVLALKKGASRDELEAAMKGHILAQASLMGTYRR